MKKSMLLIAICLVSAICSGRIVRQNEKITYDKDNYLLFRDKGRIENEHSSGSLSIYHGKAIFLTVVNNGTTITLGPYDTLIPRPYRMSSDVRQIQYSGKDKVWIISRLGHLLDGAVLIDLKSGNILQEYRGNNFSVDPSGQHITYRLNGNGVFIDNHLIYPEIVLGFNHSFPQEPRTSSGIGLGKILEKYSREAKVQKKLLAPPRWDTRNGLNLLVKEDVLTSAGKHPQFKLIRMSESYLSSLNKLDVSSTALKESEAQSLEAIFMESLKTGAKLRISTNEEPRQLDLSEQST